MFPSVDKRAGGGYNCVIPLARAVLSALEMCLIIKRYTNLFFTFTLPLRRYVSSSSPGSAPESEVAVYDCKLVRPEDASHFTVCG